jgi:hypothetical protein
MGGINCRMTFYLKINNANIARPNKSNWADYTGSLIYCYTEQGSLIAKQAYHQLGHSMTAAMIRTVIKEMHCTNAEVKAEPSLATSSICVSTMHLADHI